MTDGRQDNRVGDILSIYFNDIVKWLASDIRAIIQLNNYLNENHRIEPDDGLAPDDIHELFKDIAEQAHIHVVLHKNLKP